MLAALRDRHVDLGYDKYRERQSYLRRTLRELRRGRLNFSTPGLTTRFEFSALPADGGFLPPHTDAPSKIVTLVFAMAGEDENWDPAWGGALDVNEPREDRWEFNYHNRLADYADMEVVRSFPVSPQSVRGLRQDLQLLALDQADDRQGRRGAAQDAHDRD